MKTATIPAISLREGQQRLKPNFYLNAGKLRLDQMRHNGHPMSTIGEQSAAVYRSDIFKRQFVRDAKFGLPYISGADIMKTAPRESSRLISARYTPNMEETSLKTNQILITCAGSVGNVRLITADLEGVIGSQDIIRVDYDEQKMPYGFLYAYLASPTAYDYMQSLYYGSVIPRIEPFHVRQIPVPHLPVNQMQQIHEDIEKAARLREEATRLLTEADVVFHEGNDLQYPDSWLAPSENADKVYNRVRASQFLEVSIKARNHSYRSSRIVELWESKPGMILEDYLAKPFTNGTGGHFKRIDDANFKGAGMVSQSDLHSQNPSNYKPVKIIRASKNDYAQPEMVLFPSVGNGVGENEIFVQPTLAYKVYEGELLSGDIGRLVCHSVEDAAYLFVVLRSKAGFRLLRAFIYGTTLRRVNWQLIKGLNIPLASPALKNKISRLVMTAFEHRHEANQLENQAIQTVETAISAWQK